MRHAVLAIPVCAALSAWACPAAWGIEWQSAATQAPSHKIALVAGEGLREPFAIDFDNQDPGITHDVAIQDSSGGLVFNGVDLVGPKKEAETVPPLKAGTYKYICTFHPTTMIGELTVQ